MNRIFTNFPSVGNAAIIAAASAWRAVVAHS